MSQRFSSMFDEIIDELKLKVEHEFKATLAALSQEDGKNLKNE